MSDIDARRMQSVLVQRTGKLATARKAVRIYKGQRDELLVALQALVDYCQTPAHAAERITRAPKQKHIDAARSAIAKVVRK
jgi:hypothetical protein